MQLKGVPFVQTQEVLHEDQFEDLVSEDLTKSELETIQNEIQETDKIFEEFLRSSLLESQPEITNTNDTQINQNTNVDVSANVMQPIEVIDNNTTYLVDPTKVNLPKNISPYSETSFSDYLYVQPVATEKPPQKVEPMSQNDPVYTVTSWDDYELTLKRFRKEYDYVQTVKSSVPYANADKRRGFDPETSTSTPYCFAY